GLVEALLHLEREAEIEVRASVARVGLDGRAEDGLRARRVALGEERLSARDLLGRLRRLSRGALVLEHHLVVGAGSRGPRTAATERDQHHHDAPAQAHRASARSLGSSASMAARSATRTSFHPAASRFALACEDASST